MKQIYKALIVVAVVVSTLLIGQTNTAKAATYQSGCYVTSQGSSYQKVSCPNSSPDDAARYATGCWVSVASSSAATPYKLFDCASGGQTDAQKKAACESSGGTWQNMGTSGGAQFACRQCPQGKTTNNNICINNAPGADTPAQTGGSAQPTTSGLDDKLQFGDCPSGQVFNVAGEQSSCVAATTSKCGSGTNVVDVSFDFGCLGPAYGKELNPILDIAFALFRFLSAGVGLVVIGSIIIAGIQYSASRGNPQATQAAIKRITNAIIGLLIYIFAFAILNFIVPGGLFI